MAPKIKDKSEHHGRVPTLWRWDYKFLPVDSSAEGFYHPATADLVRRGRPSIVTKRFAHVRKMALSSLAEKVKNVN